MRTHITGLEISLSLDTHFEWEFGFMQELLLIQTFNFQEIDHVSSIVPLIPPNLPQTLLSLHQTKQFARTLITSVVHNQIFFFISVDSKQF